MLSSTMFTNKVHVYMPGDLMIADPSNRSGNSLEQAVQNTKRKRDTASGDSATVIYTLGEHLYTQNK
ncbi:hypothetical protein Tco_0394529 [Tanacetum coccineum]